MTADSAPEFRAGDRWRYRAPAGFEQSRMLIGAVVSFADAEPIVCCAVVEAPRLLPDGTVDSVNIPFLPLTAGAMRSSVVARDGEGVLPLGFGAAFEVWQGDPRGLAAFTVAFEGRLDLMIARQMVEIVGQRPANR